MEAIKTPQGTLYNCTVVPALCLDLDGTVRHSKSGEFINGPDDIALFPDVEAKVWVFKEKHWQIIGVTNQGGVAFGHKTWQEARAEVDKTAALFERNPFDIIMQCFHHPGGTHPPFNRRSLLRKPDIGMLAMAEEEAFTAGYVIDWDNSVFVGDRPEDAECAKRAGMHFMWAWEFFGRPEPQEHHGGTR